jgi:ubiquinone/menaquinone biosynthesis C-methylase UbiE
MSKYLVYLGAKSVVASDISKNMLEEAKEKYNSEKIEYLNLPMEEIDTINKKFDVVYSSLAFHYVKDFNKLINDIYNLLNDGGILIFSQESPLNTSSIVDSKSDNKITMNGKNYYLLSDYNNEGLRESKIAGSIYHKYHRSYATLVNTLVKNNFEILEMRDSIASDEAIKICDKYKNQLDKPYFTFVKARKISK